MAVLFSDTFEDTDGINITAHATGWTAQGTDPGDTMEIDTAQFQAGVSSFLINHNASATGYIVYHAFTQQTTEIFTVDLYYRPGLNANLADIFTIETGTHSWDSSIAFLLEQDGANIKYWTGGWNAILGATLVINTWHRIEVEFNCTAQTFNLWFDGIQRITNGAMYNSLSPNRIYFFKVSNNNYPGTAHIDNLNIYEGARAAAGGLSIPVAMANYRRLRTG